MRRIIVGIDASRNRSGGAKAYLIGIFYNNYSYHTNENARVGINKDTVTQMPRLILEILAVSVLIFIVYFLTIFSTIGYGFALQKITGLNKYSLNIGFIGLSGILFMTILSYITNLFVSHNFIHNSIFLIIGLTTFFLLILKKKIT